MKYAVCSSTMTDEQKAERAASRAVTDVVWAKRQSVTVDGRPFSVAVMPDVGQALVYPVDTTQPVSIAQMERAAAEFSGCSAQDTSVLAFMSGSDTALISLRTIAADYLTMSLSC